ncbi:hypothetical protein [Streptomyces sp. NPDC088847]|uniref:hypothetical protein n=1 Tax=Streptomyces sp. NPDC088847 TaxID=3365909 RepID=UPI003811BEB3
MKDLEGIGAVASAGVAAVGIVATLLLGRWALRGSQDAAQAGLAQAAATYQAALDQVRAQSHSEHQHWRRTLRREAYATLLQAVLAYSDHAEKVIGQGLRDARLVNDLIDEANALERDMGHKEFVVRLEGPDEVSGAAQSLISSAKGVMQVGGTLARSELARLLVADRADSHPQEVARVREITATYRTQGYWSLIGTDRMPTEAGAMLGELRRLLARIDVSSGYMGDLCVAISPSSYGDAVNVLTAAYAEFIAAARNALDGAAI